MRHALRSAGKLMRVHDAIGPGIGDISASDCVRLRSAYTTGVDRAIIESVVGKMIHT